MRNRCSIFCTFLHILNKGGMLRHLLLFTYVFQFAYVLHSFAHYILQVNISESRFSKQVFLFQFSFEYAEESKKLGLVNGATKNVLLELAIDLLHGVGNFLKSRCLTRKRWRKNRGQYGSGNTSLA